MIDSVLRLINMPSVIGIGGFRKHGRVSELEQLEAINATQDFLLSEPVDISKYLDEQIQQRERDRNSKQN